MKSVLYAFAGLFFTWLFYERFWKWRDCIDEALSSCITPEGANLTSGGIFWGLFAIVFFILAPFAFIRRRSKL